jgi:hypothetical protein
MIEGVKQCYDSVNQQAMGRLVHFRTCEQQVEMPF